MIKFRDTAHNMIYVDPEKIVCLIRKSSLQVTAVDHLICFSNGMNSPVTEQVLNDVLKEIGEPLISH